MRKAEVTCQTCNKIFEGQVSIFMFSGKIREIRPRECPDCASARTAEDRRLIGEELQFKRERVRQEWWRSCGIPDYLRGKTFANFDGQFQRNITNAVQNWVEGFLIAGARDYPSLILYSEGYGCGKTHLVCAIANRIIESWSGDPEYAVCPVRFESGPGLVRRIRATYNIRDSQPYHETEEMVYNQLRGTRLLILDDVGKEKPSDHTREVYFHIISERLNSGLPVLITSNLPLEGNNSLEQLMGEGAVSRLIGMSQGNYFKLRGADFRRREKKP